MEDKSQLNHSITAPNYSTPNTQSGTSDNLSISQPLIVHRIFLYIILKLSHFLSFRQT